MKAQINKVISTYDLEPVFAGTDRLEFRVEIFYDGKAFFARLIRYEFYRLQPSFPQAQRMPDPSLASDEVLLVRDGSIGPTIEKLREASEETLLNKILIILHETFPPS